MRIALALFVVLSSLLFLQQVSSADLRCNGILATNATACSGNGLCKPIGVDTIGNLIGKCICNGTYTGDSCQQPVLCNGISALQPAVCNGRGKCVELYDSTLNALPPRCECAAGFSGRDCERNSFCNNVNGTLPNVCGGRGKCVQIFLKSNSSADVCDCNTGFVGTFCGMPAFCNGLNATNPNVCSGRGKCIAALDDRGYPLTVAKCSCPSGWIGDNCEIPLACNGIPASDPNVCSASGTCGPIFDTTVLRTVLACTCRPGFIGKNCEFGLRCNNIPATDPSVCNFRNGTCSPQVDTTGAIIASNVGRCVCRPGFSGSNCASTTTCPSNCNGRGECIQEEVRGVLQPPVCKCKSGYFGTACEVQLQCPNTNNQICSNNGNCVKAYPANTSSNQGLCICNAGYIGVACAGTPQCPTENGLVCGGRGDCVVVPGTTNAFCQCYDKTVVGAMCDRYPLCDVPANVTGVCSGRGQCLPSGPGATYGYCQCQAGFTGKNCEISLRCGNYPASDNRVCSGRGTCVNIADAGTGAATVVAGCDCQPGFFGANCEQELRCGGKSFNDTTVCSGNGECAVVLDRTLTGIKVTGPFCKCRNGFGGPLCNDNIVCNGVSASNGNVCSGKGKCMSPSSSGSNVGLCACEPGFGGPNCERASMCNGFAGNSTQACSSRGSCSRGLDDFAADRCYCEPNYEGTRCENLIVCGTKAINDPDVCTRRGTCVKKNLFTPAVCECQSGYSGRDCESVNNCPAGFYGPQCNIFISSFQFDATFTRMFANIKVPNFVDISKLTCQSIFSSKTLDRIGSFARCVVTDSTLAVQFSADAKIIPTEIIEMKINDQLVFVPSVGPTAPSITTPSEPRIVSQPNVGSCSTIQLDGSLSRSADGKELRYVWDLASNSPATPQLKDFLANQFGPKVVVPNNLLTNGAQYTFTLKVQSQGAERYFGLMSNVTSITISKTNNVLPQILVPFTSIEIQDNQRVDVNPEVVVGDLCGGVSMADVRANWTKIAGPNIGPIPQGKALRFAEYSFQTPGKYDFEFAAWFGNNATTIARVVVSIIVKLGPFRLNFPTNYFTISRNMNLKIPAVFEQADITAGIHTVWSCMNGNTPCNVGNPQFSPNTREYLFPPNTFSTEATFVLNANITSRGRSAQTQFTVVVINDGGRPLPRIAVTINADNKRILFVDRDNYINALTDVMDASFAWNLTSGSIPDSSRITGWRSRTLKIPANVLVEGNTYNFRVAITSGPVTINAEAQVQTNTPPTAGLFNVEPATGQAGSTRFTLTCSQWSDVEDATSPLRYQFAFVDTRGNDGRLVYLSPMMSTNTLNTLLPGSPTGSLTLVALGYDSVGAVAKATFSVNVTAPTVSSASDINNIISGLNSNLAGNTASEDEIRRAVASAASTLNRNDVKPSDPCQQRCTPGRGTCTNNKCVCSQGFAGEDCSVTIDQLRQRQTARAQMADKLKHMKPTSSDELMHLIDSIGQLARQPDELNNQTKIILSNVLHNALANNTLSVSQDIANAAVQAANMILRAFSQESLTTEQKASLEKLKEALKGSFRGLMQNIPPGGDPVNLSSDTLTGIVKKDYPSNLRNVPVNGTNGEAVTLPSEVFANFTGDQSASVTVLTYTNNPNDDGSRTNILSKVVSVGVYVDDNEKKINNLQNQIQITIPRTDSTLNSTNAKCKYYDTVSKQWSSVGLQVVRVTSNSIVCSTTHLTDFGVDNSNGVTPSTSTPSPPPVVVGAATTLSTTLCFVMLSIAMLVV